MKKNTKKKVKKIINVSIEEELQKDLKEWWKTIKVAGIAMIIIILIGLILIGIKTIFGRQP